MPWQLSWRYWNRKLRIAATGASTGCAENPSCLRARPGKPSSTTESPWRCGSNWTSWPRAALSSAASTCWPSGCPAPARPTPGAPGPPPGGSRPLRPLRSGLPPGAGTARRQARSGPAPPTAQAGQLDFLLLDDLGYLPQGAEESEVLFTLIAERYERRSLGITSNLVFSEWERIFANPTTAAAIDRVVHHSVILEFTSPATAPTLPSNASRPRR